MSEPPRFEMDATDLGTVAEYFRRRAVQGLIDGWRWSGSVDALAEGGATWGARTLSASADGVAHQSVYVLAPHRGRGYLSRYVAAAAEPFVTGPDCDLEDFFARRGVPFVVAGRFTQTREYAAIARHFGGRRAARSGVPYMNHIDEGLAVLRDLGATERARRAWCLHPMLQLDADLPGSYADLAALSDDPGVLVLAMEYRNVANAYLSRREVASIGEIALSPLPEVADMLRADKVQNYKDFLLHHGDAHPRAAALHRYFAQWLARLGVGEARFSEWFVSLQVGGERTALSPSARRGCAAPSCP
ncbi:MAG: hypothetical protein JWM10_3640 [Myxococcaceae bacterium]|nr:hypothetical protein [Myxococcaceae bacterium]